MQLLLIRHAQAEAYAASDAARSLTEKGKVQSEKVASLLSASDLRPDITISSPLVRARQTAEIFCKAGGFTAPIIEAWLACGMRPSDAMQQLMTYREFERVAMVGHEPDFSSFAEWLLGSQAGGIHVRKASVLLFSNVRPPSQGAYLEMLLPVSVADL
ncbi:MAG: SixA phosphatase family protein [Akkermansiaceae bacterium]